MSNGLSLRRRAAVAFQRFLRLEAAGGILLVLAAMLALGVANSPLADAYVGLFQQPWRIAGYTFATPAVLWINDGLMALFFLLVGLELKRELVIGQFADRAQILLPGVCALMGMLVPMALYALVNRGDPLAMRGVAIPAATDIAFALGVLMLLGSRVPLALKLLLTAIAVADDLGAIVIIAVWYTDHLSLAALAAAAVAFVLLLAMNRRGVGRVGAYLAVGALLWLAMLKSGVHPTLAGVLLGMAIPLRTGATTAGADDELGDGGDRDGDGRGDGPLATIEHALNPWVAYAILPLFAFANAGVPLAGLGLGDLAAPVPLGILLGLFVGKQVGIFAAALVLVKLGFVRRPDGVDWGALYGMSILCGIGFTMSLFIGALSFDAGHAELIVQSRVGILGASALAAVTGYAFLAWRLPRVPA